jgi:hypothetical protein
MKRHRAGLILLAVLGGAGAAAGQSSEGWVGKDLVRKVIYHSPQTPGYTAWVGAWVMPDGAFMVCFTQVTGPLEGRPRKHDFTGLDRKVVYLRSTDRGATWTSVGSSGFGGPGAHACGGGGHFPLRDGTLLRRVNGYDLVGEPDVPYTAFLERSADGGKTWGKRQILLDPARFLYQFSRFRRLRDGRILALGQCWHTPAGSSLKDYARAPIELLLMVSADEGTTWEKVDLLSPRDLRGNWADEWDAAELANGDLLGVFRRRDPADRKKQVRWQGVLRKSGKGWVLEDPGPSALEHSGHPELLVTREGLLLHLATTGVHGTEDGGKTWTRLPFPDLKGAYGLKDGYRTSYYPVSFQTPDGRIHVFAHRGYDNIYGEVDQAVIMDTFRLERP